MSDLPDWSDDEAMLAWLIAKLDAQDEIEINRRSDSREIRDWIASDGPAVEAAELDDDVAPLQRRYPHLARFIHPQRLPRGKHRPSRRKGWYDISVIAAAADVPRIRELWQRHYKRRNRATGFVSPPEWFAAQRWGVNEADVDRRLDVPK
jgi:hypothetical protein